jgi:hypothetical protein
MIFKLNIIKTDFFHKPIYDLIRIIFKTLTHTFTY